MFGIIPKVSKAIMASNALPATLKSFICAPAGPLTIFFWAPAIKWVIIFANVQTFTMPVDMISNRLQMVLMLTGLTWTRYSFVITPKNYMLAAVNSFMAGTAIWQLYRKNIREKGKTKAIAAAPQTETKKPEQQQQQQSQSASQKK